MDIQCYISIYSITCDIPYSVHWCNAHLWASPITKNTNKNNNVSTNHNTNSNNNRMKNKNDLHYHCCLFSYSMFTVQTPSMGFCLHPGVVCITQSEFLQYFLVSGPLCMCVCSCS
jgi:hypothetical protein